MAKSRRGILRTLILLGVACLAMSGQGPRALAQTTRPVPPRKPQPTTPPAKAPPASAPDDDGEVAPARERAGPAPREANSPRESGPPRDPRTARDNSASRENSGARENAQPREKARGGEAARAPRFPQLAPGEIKQLDAFLARWEESSAKILRFRCDFKRWEYDAVFGKRNDKDEIIPTQAAGSIKYQSPDKGLYEIDTEAVKERWICDGKSLFEFNFKKKQLIERPLPPELQGRAIVDGPLPFFFGAEARKLKNRYFMRLVTPEGTKDQVWIEAWPRTAGDAANFHHATLILGAKELSPMGLEVVDPAQNRRTIHQFEPPAINDIWSKLAKSFFVPETPRGWEKVVDRPPADAAPPRDEKGPRDDKSPPPAQQQGRNAPRPLVPVPTAQKPDNRGGSRK